MAFQLPDPSTPFGARVAQRLRDETVAWLTTVDAAGTPQPNPIWFLWDGASFLIYTRPEAKRLAHIARHPQIALHFDTDGNGDDVIVFTGRARHSDEPPPDQVPEYLAKYAAKIARLRQSPAEFGAEYATALRVIPERVRGF